MNIFGILSMIGGLALFLYGMDAMGAGLSKLSGGRMERLLRIVQISYRSKCFQFLVSDRE